MNIPTFIAIDLETTGLEFDKDEIIEVALVRFENGKATESVDYLVRPATVKLRPFIESLTGITQKELDESEDFASLAGKIRSFIGDSPIVAHNASFDARFLKSAFAKVGIDFENHPVWDSLTLSRIAFQDVPNHRLDTLVQALGIEQSRAHRALPDAEACGNLFVKSFEKISSMDSWLMDALVRVGAGSHWEALFGSAAKADNSTAENASAESRKPAYKIPEVAAESGAAVPAKGRRVSEFFDEGGLLSKQIPEFAYRKNQAEYAAIAERNMYKGGLCVIEAPTGSGKSMAYLVAAANKAVAGERVVISTATHALQEQLWNHDIPQIEPLFDGRLKVSMLKGRDNYLCLRKFEQMLECSAGLLQSDERDSFMALLPWVETTTTGDINECTSFNHNRNRVLWSKLSSSAATCEGEKCPHYSRCPAMVAKRRAAASNMLLVNHALFMADLKLDFALLPAYEHIVFDEAHRLPEVSNQAQGRLVSFFGFRNTVKTLVPSRLNKDGLVAEIENRIPAEETALLAACEELIGALNETEKCLHRFFMKIGKRIGKLKTDKTGLIYRNGILAEYDADPKPFVDQFLVAASQADKLFDALAAVPATKGLVKDARGAMEELSRFMTDFEFLTKAGRNDWVFYLEEPFNPHTLKMHAYPLHSGDTWKEKFYPWIKSALFTSATLAVQGDLSYFVQKMGMSSDGPGKRPFLKVFPDEQARNSRTSVIVTKYLPKPSTAEFGEALNETLLQVLPKTDENALVLFTSVSTMLKAQAALAPAFAAKNKLLLCQHVDGSLDGLVSMFRKSRGACLLGCQTLWEGVDFPGDALKLLVITKLPFPNPSDPLVAGISADMKSRGENTFKSYFVPEAYMELRQGLGRLIRTESDSGKILILDNRVVNEAYGKTFMRIWNNKQQVATSSEELDALL
ncbi:MAG: 3'-5' exoribonuclease [Fibrobacter sp.]|nr:3'-5' exoribonuclease [Fibrobacter sp.]